MVTRVARRPRVVVRPRGLKIQTQTLTLSDYLIMTEEQGKTTLEKFVAGYAKLMNIRFDAAQKWLPLTGGFEKTIADFWIDTPPTAIFVDGIQHELRPDIINADKIKRGELESQGIRVVALGWRQLIENPRDEIGKILWATS